MLEADPMPYRKVGSLEQLWYMIRWKFFRWIPYRRRKKTRAAGTLYTTHKEGHENE